MLVLLQGRRAQSPVAKTRHRQQGRDTGHERQPRDLRYNFDIDSTTAWKSKSCTGRGSLKCMPSSLGRALSMWHIQTDPVKPVNAPITDLLRDIIYEITFQCKCVPTRLHQGTLRTSVGPKCHDQVHGQFDPILTPGWCTIHQKNNKPLNLSIVLQPLPHVLLHSLSSFKSSFTSMALPEVSTPGPSRRPSPLPHTATRTAPRRVQVLELGAVGAFAVVWSRVVRPILFPWLDFESN